MHNAETTDAGVADPGAGDADAFSHGHSGHDRPVAANATTRSAPLFVLRSKRRRGVERVGGDGAFLGADGKPVALVKPSSGVRALAHKWTTDAHAVQYLTLNGDGRPRDRQARLNKRGLRPLVEAGYSVEMHWLLADVDNHNHGAWPDDSEAFECAVTALRATLDAHDLTRDAGCYMTRHGYRLLWQLAESVPITPETEGQVEGRIRGVHAALAELGIEADATCCDWTRLFRLPFVKRDGHDERLPAWNLATPGTLDVHDFAPVPKNADDKPPDAPAWRLVVARDGDAGAAWNVGHADPKGRRVVQLAHADGQLLASDRLDLTSATARARVAKPAAAALGIDRAEVDAELLQLADKLPPLVPGAVGCGDDDDSERSPLMEVLDEARGRCTLLRDHDGAVFAVCQDEARPDDPPARLTLPVGSREFKFWLRRVARVVLNDAVLGPEAFATITAEIEADGHRAPEHRVALRVAGSKDGVALDLGDGERLVLVGTDGGWRIEPAATPIAYFWRPRAMRALPEPEAGAGAGAFDSLWGLVNVPTPARPLVLGWLMAALAGVGPYPVLLLRGPQGSAKSTTAAMLHRLLDPHACELRRTTNAISLWRRAGRTS